MPEDCRPAEQSEAPFMKERDDKISHLIAISMNHAGFPIRLFTTNRWITADNWYKADDIHRIMRLSRLVPKTSGCCIGFQQLVTNRE